jgi:DNA-directed RNA polymerase subunit RPC12/RpoP
MSTVKSFECDDCGAIGKITIRGDDYKYDDVVFCPVCGHDIFEEEDIDEDDE